MISQIVIERNPFFAKFTFYLSEGIMGIMLEGMSCLSCWHRLLLPITNINLNGKSLERRSMEFPSLGMSEILESLFGSKAKTRILRFFLLNPEKEFSPVDVASKNMIAVASVRKEINDLKKIKFIIEKTHKGKKSYILNKEFYYYSELKSLFARSTASPQTRSLSKIKNIGDVKLALVSGIFLNYPKSKVDMVLVANNVSRGKLRSVMNSLEAEIGKEVSFVLMSSEEFKYRLDMLDRFLLDFMEGTHMELIDKIPGLKRFILGLKKY